MIEKFKDKIIKNNIAKNSLIIMYGQTIASAISFFNAMLVIRAIGVYGNGIMSIAISYSAMFSGLFDFQSYNAIIKFGADALEEKDYYKYKKYLKQALIQDITTAIITFIVGFLCVNLVGSFMNWNEQIVSYIKLYMITILFSITGSLNGMLRLNDEYKVGARIAITVTIIKFIILICAQFLDVELIFYVLTEVMITAISNIMLFYYAFKCLKKNNCHDFLHIKIRFDKEFTVFNIYNNIVSTIDMPTGQLVNLIINKFLGISDVGIYNIFTKFGSLLTKITDPVTQSLLPELSKLAAKRKLRNAYKLVRKIFIYTNIGGGLVIVFLMITYKLWLGLFMTINYYNIICLVIYFIYISITSSVSGIHLLFVSVNLVKYNLPITIVCNSIYLIILYVLTINLGLIGILVSLIIQAVTVVVVKLIILMKKMNESEEIMCIK